MSQNPQIGSVGRDADALLYGGDDKLRQDPSGGIKFIRMPEVVLDENATRALLEILRRSQRMITAPMSDESLKLQHRRSGTGTRKSRACRGISSDTIESSGTAHRANITT